MAHRRVLPLSSARRAHRARARRRLTPLLAGLFLVAAMGGCTAGPHDDTPAPVILVVGNISQTSNPFGDILTSGGTIPDDSIQVDFTSRLKNPNDPTQPALQDIIIERYEVTFERTDGGTAVPKGFQRGVNARVRVTPHGQQNEFITTLDVTVMPSTNKAQPPISHLISPGVEPGTGYIHIQVRATIRFFGTTVSGQAVSAQATVGINFANFGDSNS